MKLIIDNQIIETKAGTTVLDAAEKNNISIPHLCYHPELTPYGGCRLCIVEIEGMRGYPTSCTTLVDDGMIVRANTKTLQEMRGEILQLILSEHPAACLVCEEARSCADYQQTIRKVGVTTGCRWCPKDGDCELQKVVEQVGIDKITFPVYYRGMPVEKDDPFFDRDYNLCIYCGRCVRICNEQRKSSVISLKQRGRLTTIGPAFEQSHISAGCEFCGACVSVCPTGTLSEKSRKWWGVPESYHKSVCPLCSLQCDIQVLTKRGKIIGTLPPGDPHLSGGELCVKGRFCLTELVNHVDRLQEPKRRDPEGIAVITWDQAIQDATAQLRAVDGERVAFYLSPNLTTEEIVAAKQFASKVMKTNNITSSVLDANLLSFLSLAQKSIPLDEIEKSGSIVSIFLNGNYNYAPLTLAIKRAAENGIPYFQIGWMKDTTSRFAQKRIIPPIGKEKIFFKKLAHALSTGSKGSEDIRDLLKIIRENSPTTFIIGQNVLDLTEAAEILDAIQKLVGRKKIQLFAPNTFGNIKALLSIAKPKMNDEITQLIDEGKIDLLYLIGDSPPFLEKPSVKYIIHQSSFAPDADVAVDLILPSMMWGEIAGSYAGKNGDRKFIDAITKSENVLSNIEIIQRIAHAMGKKDFSITQKELLHLIPKKMTMKLNGRLSLSKKKVKSVSIDLSLPYVLIQSKSPHTFYNISLSKAVNDMTEIAHEDTVMIHPTDAARIDVHDGDTVIVESHNTTRLYPVISRKNISQGIACLATSSKMFAFNSNPCSVQIRRNNV